MREQINIEDRKRPQKELCAVELTEFRPQDVHEFRRIFVAQDRYGKDHLSFEAVRWQIHQISPLNEKLDLELREAWRQVMPCEGEETVTTSTWSADFPDFLLLMRHLLDIDFAGIKAKTARFDQ